MATYKCFDWENGSEDNASPFDADSAKDAAELFVEDRDGRLHRWEEEAFVGVVDEHGTVTTWRVLAEQDITYKAEEA